MTLQLPNPERLDELKKKTGFSEFIIGFAYRLKAEPSDVTSMVKKMENAIRYAHVDKWADNTDLIGRISDVTKFDITDGTSDSSRAMDTVSGMTSGDELGGLRIFSHQQNDKYLDQMSNELSVESPDEVRARALVDQAYDKSNNTTFTSEAAHLADQVQKFDNSNFAVAA